MPHSFEPAIQVARSIDEIVDLRPVWAKTQSRPDADMDFYLTLLRTRREILRPHVIALKNNGSPESLLIGRMETKRLAAGLGYAKLALPPMRCLTFVGGGPIGDQSRESVAVLLRSVETSLKTKEADVAWFHQVQCGSSMHGAIEKMGGLLCRDFFPSFNDHWSVRLPHTYEEFLRQRSKKTRQDIRRCAKRLQGLFDDQMIIRRFREPQDIDRVMADTEAIAQRTYLRGLSAGFTVNQETRERMLLYAKEGSLRVHILYVGDRPIAFWHGFFYGRTFYPWTIGYDPEYHEVHPGLFLLQKVVEDLCAEQAADVMDFGAGDAHYKRDWADENHREVSMYLFAPTVKGLLVNLLRTPLLACSQAARWSVEKADLLARTKRAWRSHLAKQATLEAAKQH